MAIEDLRQFFIGNAGAGVENATCPASTRTQTSPSVV
jgi:hypothetical protein